MQFGILGPLEVRLTQQPVDLGRPKQRAVLAVLILNGNRVVSRDRFVEVLWPDEGADRSTASLPVYVANLRRLLEPERPARTAPGRILTRPPGYLLRVEDDELDASRFEALAAEGQHHLDGNRPQAARRALASALGLWRGPALAEFRFAELEAARLEELRLVATEARLCADLALGGHVAAVAELERIVAEHRLRERLAGLLMLALYRSGRQAEALRAFTRARAFLGEELGIEPGPELRRLESEILAHSPALDWVPPAGDAVVAGVTAPRDGRPDSHGFWPDLTLPRSDVLVGRTAELAAVDRAVDELVARPAPRAGSVVLIAGEPGIGKTRLAYEAALAAGARGCTLAWGRCNDGQGAPPFWPWIQVVRCLLGRFDAAAIRDAAGPDAAELALVVPELAGVLGEVAPPPALDPAAARFRLFEAFARFLERLSVRRPLVLVVDDLQWADSPSLGLLAHLAARPGRLAVLLIATYREVDPAPGPVMADTLATLARAVRRVDLPLPGLSHDEVGRLVASAAGVEPAAGVVDAVWDRTGGNPFFAGELTRLLVAEQTLTEVAATTGEVPRAVRQVIGRRVDRLPADVRALLTVAAVTGHEFDVRVVAAAAEVDLDTSLDRLDVARAAGVVRARHEAERLQFSHALVHQTVYEMTAGLRRARLHARVADALEVVDGEGRHTAKVAHHRYRAVAVVGVEAAVAASQEAAEASYRQLASEVAEEHLRRALELIATMAPGRARDRCELDVQVQLAALLTLVKGVAAPDTAAAWTRATQLCREDEDQRRFFASLWGQFSFAWASGDLNGGRAMGEHILHLGRASGEPVVTAAAHLAIGGVALCGGDLAEGTKHLELGKELADTVPDHQLGAVTYADLRVQMDSWLGMARHLAGRHDEGATILAAVVARARQIGDPFTVAIGLAFAVFGGLLSDEADDVRRRSQELAEHAGRHQLADFALHAGVAQATAALHDERPPVPGDLVAVLESLPPAGQAGIRPWRPFWMALAAGVWTAAGEPERARQVVDEALAEVEAMGSSFSTAELYRLRGELATGSDGIADLRHAAGVAARQGAVTFQRRAEAALAARGVPAARHHRRTGPGTSARPAARHRSE